MKGMLNGIRVLDFGRYVSCPYCGYLLASLGAEVIKVEDRRGDDSRRIQPYSGKDALMFHCNNRNKKGISINFRSDEGRKLLRELADNADVIIENFKPGTLAKMGIGYEEVSKTNPRIIVASITGYGQKGTYRDRPAFDCIVSAMGGLLSINGTREAGPRLIGIPFLDNTGGVMNALGVMAALYQREKTGKGCWVDTSMWDLLVSYMAENIPNYEKNGVLLEYAENMDDPYGCPAGIFKAKDGYVYLDCGFDGIFKRFREVVGGQMMDEKYLHFDARLDNYDLLNKLTAEWAAGKTVKEIDDICEKNSITCGPINNLDTVVDGENIRSRNMLKFIDLPTGGKTGFPGMPLKISTIDDKHEDTIAPELGQDDNEVLKELLSLDDETLAALREKDIIA